MLKTVPKRLPHRDWHLFATRLPALAFTLLEMSIALTVIVSAILYSGLYLRDATRQYTLGGQAFATMQEIALSADTFYWQNCTAIQQEFDASGVSVPRVVVASTNALLSAHATLRMILRGNQALKNPLSGTSYDVYYERHRRGGGRVSGIDIPATEVVYRVVQFPAPPNRSVADAVADYQRYMDTAQLVVAEDSVINRTVLFLAQAQRSPIVDDISLQAFTAGVRSTASPSSASVLVRPACVAAAPGP